MSMGTFDAFTSARLGIYAAQYGLKVTGNNVSNINTEGYTRKRLDQVSFKAGAYDRYRSQLDNHVGSGAMVMNINQVRDPYLDVRFRNVNAEVGYTDRMLAGLQEIADILDEVNKGEDPASNETGDGLLHAQIQDLASKLRAYADEPTKSNNDLVRGSAETLCTLFNKYADRLENLYQETKQDFYDEVTEINECLTNIRDLNREIRNNEIYGDNALELRDERNRQIDKLSQYMHIRVVYSEEDIGNAQTVEKLSIYLDDDNPDDTIHTDEILLIDGIFGAQLSSPETMPLANPKYNPDCKDPKDPAAYRYLAKTTEFEPGFEGDLDHIAVARYTNDVDRAYPTENNYFGLQVGKLLDKNEKEWTNATTVQPKEDVSEPEDTLAKYEIPISFNSAYLKAGQKMIIAGNEVTVEEKDLQSPKAFADLVAENLKNATDPKYDYLSAYNISTDESGKIIFEAKVPGKVDEANTGADQPPSKAPSLAFVVTGEDNQVLKGMVTVGLVKCENNGVIYKKPAEYSNTPTSTTDAAGRETIISYEEKNGRYYKVTTYIDHTFETGLDDNDIYGSLQAIRELLTGNGEFATTDDIRKIDENAAKERGIPYYQKALDLLALQFATQYNQINQGYAVDKDGNYLAKVTKVDEDGKPVYETLPAPKITYYESLSGEYLCMGDTPPAGMAEDEYKTIDVTLNLYMTDNAKEAFNDYFKDAANGGYEDGLKGYLDANGEPMGGLLFSNRNDRDSEGDPDNLAKDPYINASNISVAHKWSTGEVELVPKYEILFGGDQEHSTQNKNANHMVNMIEKSLVYDPRKIEAGADSEVLFKGNFNDMFSRLNTTLGDDIRATNIALNTSYTQKTEIDTQRDGVSGVDLNDEAMNMMQFQKALNAAMRLMTVIDEALDRLINNTGIAGR